ILTEHKVLCAVHFAQQRLFYLAGGISRHRGEDYLSRPLVSGHSRAEFVYLLLGAAHALLYLYTGGGYLAESLVRQTYYCHLAHLVGASYIFLYMYHVVVLFDCYEVVLLSINLVYIAVVVTHRHFTGI